MNHNQKIISIKNEYEGKGFKCQREFKVWRKDLGRFSKIDICCFSKTEQPRCFEIETNKQIFSNQEDLQVAKKLFGAKICQLSSNQSLNSCRRK